MDSGWVHDELGYQRTRSPVIIRQSLIALKQQRVFLSLAQKGYQSGNTVLVDFDQDKLIIDRPLDLPKNITGSLIVQFRDKGNLQNRYQVRILSLTADSIITTLPQDFFQLQRRRQYRVGLPAGNVVSFTLEGEPCSGFFAKDISAGGMLIGHKKRQLEVNDRLENLVLEGIGRKGEALCISISQVVRIFQAEEIKRYFAGLLFSPTRQEEEALLKFVRKLELEQIRRLSAGG
ncbi:MAG: PilZ domain-containing protein [Proteobacteria bacterium]|nr:PilZ domain-containing protein [Pseudomonadota bacterium]MBU1688516.1 PilZ domain-containing protein [Pseudomonadota bacterium]